MREIARQIQELLDALLRKNSEADSKALALENEAFKQTDIAKKQAEKQVELNDRETEVKKIEDIVALKAEGIALKNKVAVESQKLIEEKKAYNTLVDEKTQESNTLKKNLESTQAALREQEALLKEREAKLEEDRKNLRKQVIDEVANNISKNVGK